MHLYRFVFYKKEKKHIPSVNRLKSAKARAFTENGSEQLSHLPKAHGVGFNWERAF